MAIRTFTTAGVNNLFSNPANWDGGVAIPVDNDSVVIPLGQTCEYDYDNSAWANGIAGITVTGTLKLTRTAGTYYMKIKAAATIAGAGTFDCGASAGDAIPFAAKHTITGGAAWYINGAGGLTMTVYAAEPAIKTILLTALEPIGETVIAVDTDVTGDIWAAADTIRIDDINQAAESEERVIAGGGIAAGAITITAGLTAAKSAGAVLSLITRNVKFIGVGAAGYVAQNFASGKLTIAGGQWTTANYRCIYGSTGVNISGGTFAGNLWAFYTCPSVTITGGVFSGHTYILQTCNMSSISGGSFSGISFIAYTSDGVSISGGTFKGNYIASGCAGISISGGTFTGNGIILTSCAGGTISGGTFTSNGTGLLRSSALIKGISFVGNTVADISSSIVTCFNVVLGSAVTENTGYNSLSRETYSESIDHDQVAGAFKAWTKGGVTTKQAVVFPVGYTAAMQTALENATVEGYWQKDVLVGAGASVTITMNLRKDAAMAYLPRCIIFNKADTDPFAGGAGLNTFTMTNSIDTWESSTYTYTNSGTEDVTLVIRFQGMNAANNMYSAVTVEAINVDLTTVLANLAIVDTVVDAIKVITDQFVFTVANQVDANALTGGITPAEAADAVWDEAMADHIAAGTTGEKLNDTCCSVGSGPYTFTYNVTNSVTLLPIEGAHVLVSTDIAGANMICDGYTDVFGNVVFYLVAGTFYFWTYHPGFTGILPDIESVP